MKRKMGVVLAAAAMLAAPAAIAAGMFGGWPLAGNSTYPFTLPLTGNELIPADTALTNGQNPASELISTSQLAGFIGQGGLNYLVGGDFGVNPFQRGTSQAADITSTLTYGPDQWWFLGGASSAIDWAKETAAADIPSGFSASVRFQRKASNANTALVKMGNVLTSDTSVPLQGKQIEFSCWMKAGANFSAANSQVTMRIGDGASSNDSAANFASGSWTSYANAAAQVTTISTTWTRYSAVGTIPATATQVGVDVEWTPVGTAGTNDWVEVTGCQLAPNPGAVAYAGGATTGQSTGNMLPFFYRTAAQEYGLATRYFYQLDETNGSVVGNGMISTTNNETVLIPLKNRMRAVPTVTVTAGGFDFDIAGTNTAVGAGFAAGSTQHTDVISVVGTVTATVGQATQLVGSNTTGKITASAEL